MEIFGNNGLAIREEDIPKLYCLTEDGLFDWNCELVAPLYQVEKVIFSDAVTFNGYVGQVERKTREVEYRAILRDGRSFNLEI